MKRVRKTGAAGGRGNSEGGLTPFGQALPSVPTWQEAVGDKPDAPSRAWSMSTTFARDEIIEHPKFGKGVVVMVQGAKIQVLFQEGTKMLGHAG
ncbi:MAG: hypothetical protein U0269_06960 [Polyangiales bacterium]